MAAADGGTSAADGGRPEPDASPEEYRQRALLLADLGRYDEAAGEVAAGLLAAPADAALLATLARLHLAAEQPAEALVAADRAVAAAPDTVNPLVVRAMALTDSRRFADAANVAGDILRRWPEDPYAQRTGAALLSESRNGQEALNAAWLAVKSAPQEAEAHLVLAVVSARLRLFDLAQRAYAEALDLDLAIGDAQTDVGVVRLERRRWAQALEGLADEAALDTPPTVTPPPGDAGYPSSFPRAYEAPDVAEGDDDDVRPVSPGPTTGGRTGWFDQPVSKPTGPVLSPASHSAGAVRQAVLYGANGTLVLAVLTAGMTLISAGAARVWAGMLGALVLAAIPVGLSRQLTEPLPAALSRVRATDRRLASAVAATLIAPLLVIGYALVGGPIPLILAMITAAAGELLVLIRRR
jgi:Flp pilus assembly protein TadD